MKTYLGILPLLLLLACDEMGSTGTTGSNDGGRRAESESELGRFVSGTRSMNEHYKYNLPCTYIGESFLKSMFALKEDADIIWRESESTCEVVWNNKVHVSVSTTGIRPFESMFHADYYFDSLYQPGIFTQRSHEHRSAFTGPNPEGTGAESPRAVVLASATQGTGLTPATALNDSTQAHTDPEAPTAQLNDNTVIRAVPNTYPGMWEKAIWNPQTKT